MPRHDNHSIPVRGSFCATTPPAAVSRLDRLARNSPRPSGFSPAHKPSLFSLSRASTPVSTREHLPRSGSQGSVRVERWIEDQRGEDQDPFRSSPMPRHSDTVVHSRRLTPVKPRTPVSQRDASEFVFVDDDEEVSTHTHMKSTDGNSRSDWVHAGVSVTLPPRVGARCRMERTGSKGPPLLPTVVAFLVYSAIPPRSRVGGCR